MISSAQQLELTILLPTHELLSESVFKVISEADNGEFCILPRHVDFVATLVPSILSYWPINPKAGQSAKYVAINHGVLVKCAEQITVATLEGVCSSDLAQLQNKVDLHFLELDEHERKARAALARLEAATLRGFRELQERLNG
ncbi:MAG: F-type H+-transporting ATPase subunit epsilon [Gammaproteobacteria bacterium]|jgi:F-type H+-transporting ATPase subunit epsilon